jgi:predicted amidohydrolase
MTVKLSRTGGLDLGLPDRDRHVGSAPDGVTLPDVPPVSASASCNHRSADARYDGSDIHRHESACPMKIAALQMVSTPTLQQNLDTALRLIDQAADSGARLVALPEYFCLMGRADRDKLTIAESLGEGPIQRMLSEAARENDVWVIGGTLPMRTDDPERVANACCVYGPDGRQVARYDKIHLFRFDSGKERYDEARVLRAGSKPVTFDMIDGTSTSTSDRDRDRSRDGAEASGDAGAGVDAGVGDEAARGKAEAASSGAAAASLRVGLSVCYDLRFPELYRALSFGTGSRPCDLIAVPSAFTHTTGLAHWELLLRARAVENQCYVIAPAQGGLHENGRRTWGHSMVVDPWGEVLAVRAEGEGVVLAELDLERIAAVRRQLPALQHRRRFGVADAR